MFSEFDRLAMTRALALAERGLETTHPNPRVGCVIAKGDRIIAEGWHERAGEPHAEIMALRAAKEPVAGATAYVTLEPCSHFGRTPPCANALIEAKLARVVFAVEDPNPRVSGQGADMLLRAGIAVEAGLMQAEATELNIGFMKRMKDRLPFVRVKLAMSLDGRTALANGASQWITGEAARGDVQRWRARSSVVMTGVGTVLADDPLLNVRLPGERRRQPLRVVLDSQLRTSPGAKVVGGGGTGASGAAAVTAAAAGLAGDAAGPASGGLIVFTAVGGDPGRARRALTADEVAQVEAATAAVAPKDMAPVEETGASSAPGATPASGATQVPGGAPVLDTSAAPAPAVVTAVSPATVTAAAAAAVPTLAAAPDSAAPEKESSPVVGPTDGSLAEPEPKPAVGAPNHAAATASLVAAAPNPPAPGLNPAAAAPDPSQEASPPSPQAFQARRAALEARGARIIQVPADEGFLDLFAVLEHLGKLEVNEVLVEAGPTLAGQLVTNFFVDELLLYVAPKLLGPQSRPLVNLPELQSLQDAWGFTVVDAKRFGEDLRLRMRPK